MQREITQRELRNESGVIMRALDAGQSFIVTRNGVRVAELSPVRRGAFTPKMRVLEAFKNAAPLGVDRLRKDLDAIVDQNPKPRA